MNSTQLQQYIDSHNKQVEIIDELRFVISEAYNFMNMHTYNVDLKPKEELFDLMRKHISKHIKINNL